MIGNGRLWVEISKLEKMSFWFLGELRERADVSEVRGKSAQIGNLLLTCGH